MAKLYAKTFATGGGVAIRLPPELNIAPDATVWLEKNGNDLLIHLTRPPAVDMEEERGRVERLVANLLAAGPVGEVERRLSPEQPDRPGL